MLRAGMTALVLYGEIEDGRVVIGRDVDAWDELIQALERRTGSSAI